MGAGWEWTPNIWASVSPWRRRMNKAVSTASHWGDLESSRGRRCLAAGRLWEVGPARPWVPAAKMKSGLVCPTSGPRSRPAVSVPLRSSTPRHGRAPDLIGRALGSGGCRSPGAAHRSFQHPELRRQQSVRPGLRRHHRASEAGGRGGVAAGLLGLICARLTLHLLAPPPDPGWL